MQIALSHLRMKDTKWYIAGGIQESRRADNRKWATLTKTKIGDAIWRR